MRVHARPVDAEERLWHERRVQVVAHRHVFHDEPERADVIRRRQHIVVTEVDLMLPCGDLVVSRLDVEAHGLECQDDLAAHVLALVHRRQVEIASGVVRLGRRRAVLALKQEKLRLGPRVHHVALLGSQGDHPLQRRSRTALERLAIRTMDVADHPRDLLAPRVAPRENRERIEVRTQVHVRLFDPNEALDRRPVEHDFAVQRIVELAVGDLDVLDRPEDVCELQPQELDPLLFSAFENAGFLRP
jgi:hypothetical protein